MGSFSILLSKLCLLQIYQKERDILNWKNQALNEEYSTEKDKCLALVEIKRRTITLIYATIMNHGIFGPCSLDVSEGVIRNLQTSRF